MTVSSLGAGVRNAMGQAHALAQYARVTVSAAMIMSDICQYCS